jgi:uncharacterized protein (TIGR00730 family)
LRWANGWGVVYGGSRNGVMGAVATGALREGGEVIGVVPQRLVRGEVARTDLSELRVVGTMHERKAAFAALSDAFVAIPGGIGTLDELFEAWTWSMIGIHDLPVILLNHEGYYDALLAFIDNAVRSGFVDAHTRRRLLVASTLDETLATLRARLT